MSLYDFLWGWCLFSLAKKGGLKKFWGPKGGGPWKFFATKFFCIRPPPLQVFVNGPLVCHPGIQWDNLKYWCAFVIKCILPKNYTSFLTRCCPLRWTKSASGSTYNTRAKIDSKLHLVVLFWKMQTFLPLPCPPYPNIKMLRFHNNNK